jgi:hypothetical protein
MGLRTIPGIMWILPRLPRSESGLAPMTMPYRTNGQHVLQADVALSKQGILKWERDPRSLSPLDVQAKVVPVWRCQSTQTHRGDT